MENLKGIDVGVELTKRLLLDNSVELRFNNDAISYGIGTCSKNTDIEQKRLLAIIIDEGFGAAFLDRGSPILSGSEVPEGGVLFNLPYKEGVADDYFLSGVCWHEKEATNC